MSKAGRRSLEPTHALCALLQPQFRGLSAPDLLAHFRQRVKPVLPVVEDAAQTTPELLRGVMEGRFSFNNELHTLGSTVDWTSNPSRDIEWQILLHKFYYLVGLARHWRDTQDDAYARRAIDLTSSWIATALPPGFIAADVDGRRIQNWIYAWSMLVHAPAFSAEDNLDLLERLHADVIWLSKNLHAKRNHRTLELYAVFLWAVAFPEFSASRDLRASALAALTDNALADFKPDGSHCEQSTHYHCIVLRNFVNVVQLARLNRIELDPGLEERLRLATEFAAAVHRPDGEIPALSDADGGSYLDVVGIAERFLSPVSDVRAVRSFQDAGLVTITSKSDGSQPASERCFIAFDAGPIGEGNHGHLDALSVEIYGHGSPLIVDPGRYTYDEAGEINWRAAFRGTRAHSTVMIDNKNQARYEPRGKKWKITGTPPVTTLHGVTSLTHAVHAHGSTLSSEYPVRHDRHVFFLEDKYWLIIDLLSGAAKHQYDLRYQLAPELHDVDLSLERQHIRGRSGLLACDVWGAHPLEAEIETGWVSRQYGEKTRAPRLRIGCKADRTAFAALIVPTRAEQQIVDCAISFLGDSVQFRHKNQTSGLSHMVRADARTATCKSRSDRLEHTR